MLRVLVWRQGPVPARLPMPLPLPLAPSTSGHPLPFKLPVRWRVAWPHSHRRSTHGNPLLEEGLLLLLVVVVVVVVVVVILVSELLSRVLRVEAELRIAVLWRDQARVIRLIELLRRG